MKDNKSCVLFVSFYFTRKVSCLLPPFLLYLAKWVLNFGALVDSVYRLCLLCFADGLIYLEKGFL